MASLGSGTYNRDMKNTLVRASLACNVFLAVAALWLFMDLRETKAQSEQIMRQCARADERYISLLATSLEVLESATSEEAVAYKESIRALVAVGLENIELRKSVGFPR